MGIGKLEELKNIQGDLAKINFVNTNKHDKDFISALRFLLDPLITTNISRTKWDKIEADYNPNININNLLDYLQRISGKNSEVSGLKYFIEHSTNLDIKDVVEGIICKDYVTGFGNKAWDKVFPEDRVRNISYLGCKSYSMEKLDKLFDKNKDGLYAEIKNDGQFLFAFCYEDKIVFRTRQGLEQNIQGKLVDNLKALRNLTDYDFVLNGEALIRGYENNRDEANGILRGLSASNYKIYDSGDIKERAKFNKKNGISIEDIEDKLYYVTWDIVPLDKYKKGLDDDRYEIRSDKLSSLIGELTELSDGEWDYVSKTEGTIVNNKQEVFEYFYRILDKGLEGIVLKSPDTPFKDGKPSSQLKFKIEFNCELKVIGFEQGRKASKYENTLGSLICQSEDGLLITGVSGFKDIKKNPTDITRDEVWNNKEEWLGKIITVKCNGVSTNAKGGYSLRYANYKLDRSHEKVNADTLEEILEIEKSIIELGVK